MQKLRRRMRWMIPIVVLLAFPLGGAAVFSPTATCDLAAKWAKSHSEALPSTLEEISRFPVVYQRAVIKEMPAAERQAVLTAHLLSFVLPVDSLTPLQMATVKGLAHPLSDEQKQFIKTLIGALPELAAQPELTGQALVNSARLKFRAQRLFMAPDFGLVFKRIGPAATAGPDNIPLAKLNYASMGLSEAMFTKIAESVFGKKRELCTCDGGCDVDSFCAQTQPPCGAGNCCWFWYCECTGTCHAY